MRQTFPSVEAMLDPGALSRLLGSNVRTVVVEPMNPKGDSSTGAGFLAVRVDDEAAPRVVGRTRRARSTSHRPGLNCPPKPPELHANAPETEPDSRAHLPHFAA